MRNFTTNFNDRGEASRGSILVPMLAGMIGAMTFTAFHLSNEIDKQRDLTEKVQQYNPQIAQQLHGQYDPLENLVIKRDGEHFTFDTVKDGTREQCEGKLQVHNNTAAAIGTITCTQTMQVTK